MTYIKFSDIIESLINRFESRRINKWPLDIGSLIFFMSDKKTLAKSETKDLTFADLGINKAILAVLDKLGLINPTPIQAKSIPVALDGDDLIGVAQTGTGKTFAFGIPMLQRLETYKGKGLVVLPTRELALQVDESLKKLAGNSNLKTVTLIGGENIGRQLMLLRRDPHVIVATPGRLNDHLKRKTVKLDNVKILVLDEADMMFDMGFAPQIEEILKYVSKDRQTMLFSATMPPEIIKLTATHMKTPVHIEVSPQGTTADGVDQEIYLVKKEDKLMHLEKILGDYSGSVLIFMRTKFSAKALTKKLKEDGHKAIEIHSDLSFGQRRDAMAGFKSNKYRILVGTDVAARGIDVSGIELVVNYDLPDSPKDYVHRIGRTARAGTKGKAISLATPNQMSDIRYIEKLINKNLNITKFAEPESHQPKPINARFNRNLNRFAGRRPGAGSFRKPSDAKSAPAGARSFGRSNDSKPRNFGASKLTYPAPKSKDFSSVSRVDRSSGERADFNSAYKKATPVSRDFSKSRGSAGGFKTSFNRSASTGKDFSSYKSGGEVSSYKSDYKSNRSSSSRPSSSRPAFGRSSGGRPSTSRSVATRSGRPSSSRPSSSRPGSRYSK